MIASSGSNPDASHQALPTAVAVSGAAGALGAHFVRHVIARTALPVRVLVHRTPLPPDIDTERVLQVRGSLLDQMALDRWLFPGASIVHLAWSSSLTPNEHLRSVTLLADAAARHRIARLVHCSTAVVVGRTDAMVVTEDTPCVPAAGYERSKYEIETAMASAAAGRFPLAILRPTAVFGPGLQNLVSLIESVRNGSAAVNYVRASLFGKRHLHLVPVETVVSALLFLSLRQDGAGDDPVRYIVSADSDPEGEFRAVEARIRSGLGLRAAPQRLPIPGAVLRLLLWAAGRTDTNPRRVYDASRLHKAGFVPPVTLGEAIDRYVEWYRDQARRAVTT